MALFFINVTFYYTLNEYLFFIISNIQLFYIVLNFIALAYLHSKCLFCSPNQMNVDNQYNLKNITIVFSCFAKKNQVLKNLLTLKTFLIQN